MKINKIDHIGVIVNDLPAAKAFFLDFGLEVQGEAEMGGELVDKLLGLTKVKTSLVMMRPPGGEASIELIKFHSPSDEGGVQQLPMYTLGIRHIAFLVEDLEGLVAKLKAKGADILGEIQTYENSYKLCYVRGPEGIILDLNERIK
jgi:catechol 2,3-dioxygenase-like lactoylglutathione lyase family enzyme